MTKPRRNVLRSLVGLTVTGCCMAAGVGLSNATAGVETPPWVECSESEVSTPERQFGSPCHVSVPDLPDDLLVLDVNGEVVGTVDARMLFRPPAPSADLHEKTDNQYHVEDPPLEVFGPSDAAVGIVDNTGFVPEEEIP